ncbi:unnamed protein product [Heterobilharzia americana]|nr:unnamed protein product [Heterobilharzia americana]CAH8533232.1 unnamed protein product [Heterobilharzia americana]
MAHRGMLKLVSRGLSGSRSLLVSGVSTGPRYLVTSNTAKSSKYYAVPCRLYSSQIDRQFNQVLTNEIKQEKENAFTCSPPKGFEVVRSEGCELVLRKDFSDGVCVNIEINLAGSVSPGTPEDELDEQIKKTEENIPLEAHPELRIKLTKPGGRSVIFNCSLPSREVEQQLSTDEPNTLRKSLYY